VLIIVVRGPPDYAIVRHTIRNAICGLRGGKGFSQALWVGLDGAQ
jgi:hypothetical protein